MFTGKMSTEPIPERVFALYKIVASKKGKKILRSELKDLMEPPEIHEGTSYFNEILKAATELKLVVEQDNWVSLVSQENELKTIIDFRRYVISKLPLFEDELFWKCTNTIINMNEEIYKYQKISDAPLLKYLSGNLAENITSQMILGWRFWAQFLGFGSMNEMAFLPNAYTYVKDVLLLMELEKKKEYDFTLFMNMFSKYGRILLSEQHSEEYMNIALSNAFRYLHDNGEIELKSKKDSDSIWKLHPSKNAYNFPILTIVYKGVK